MKSTIKKNVGRIALLTIASTLTVTALAGRSNCWMTGGGSIFDSAGETIVEGRNTHGFVVHCDPRNSDNLQINWEGNRFHLTSLTGAMCIDDPLLTPETPDAQFDTFIGMGEGRLNNVNGYGIYFVFTDDGQPGVGDTALIIITDPNGVEVRNIEGSLTFGNHQAHSN